MKPSDNIDKAFDLVIHVYTEKYGAFFPEYGKWMEFVEEASQYVSGDELQILPELKKVRDALYAFLYEREFVSCVKEMIEGTRKVITHAAASDLYSKGLTLWTQYEAKIISAMETSKTICQLMELRNEYLAKITEAPCVDGSPIERSTIRIDDIPF